MNKDQEKINSIIEEIDKIRTGRHDSDTTIIHIMEELGEVSRQLYNKKIGRADLDLKNLEEEIADCIMLLNRLASVYNIDVEVAINKKIEALKAKYNL
jgi:NTP pyrophosphatase (non-canonical NTP hydrolase)